MFYYIGDLALNSICAIVIISDDIRGFFVQFLNESEVKGCCYAGQVVARQVFREISLSLI